MMRPTHGRTSAAHRLLPVFVLAAVAAALPVLAHPLAAQAYRQTVVAIPEVFPEVEARSVLVRTPERDVVLLRDGDDAPDALLMATALLRQLNTEHGAPDPGTGQMIPITGFVVTRAPGPGQRRRVEDAIRRVRAAPVSDLGSVGPARWIEYPGR
jgi:hypothetical protein